LSESKLGNIEVEELSKDENDDERFNKSYMRHLVFHNNRVAAKAIPLTLGTPYSQKRKQQFPTSRTA